MSTVDLLSDWLLRRQALQDSEAITDGLGGKIMYLQGRFAIPLIGGDGVGANGKPAVGDIHIDGILKVVEGGSGIKGGGPEDFVHFIPLRLDRLFVC